MAKNAISYMGDVPPAGSYVAPDPYYEPQAVARRALARMDAEEKPRVVKEDADLAEALAYAKGGAKGVAPVIAERHHDRMKTIIGTPDAGLRVDAMALGDLADRGIVTLSPDLQREWAAMKASVPDEHVDTGARVAGTPRGHQR